MDWKSGTAASESPSSVQPIHRADTGPRTELGKQRASRNATKHAFFSKSVVRPDESRREYERLVSELMEYWQPEGAPERLLVEKLAMLIWRHRRLISLQEEEISSLGGSTLFNQAQASTATDCFLRYEVSLDRSFDRTLSQLERLQRIRRGMHVPPELNVRVSGDS